MPVKHRWAVLVLMPWVMGCASTHVVRLETGVRGAIVYEPRSEPGQVVVSQREFMETVSRLMLQTRS